MGKQAMKTWANVVCGVFLLAASLNLSAEAHHGDLKFEKGRISSLMESSVISGDRDQYLFNAKAGQALSVAISALENNAVFQLYYRQHGAWKAMQGAQEGDDARAFFGSLPASEGNRYFIEIGPTRGNATYELFVGISAVIEDSP
jgi:hypothetical protein